MPCWYVHHWWLALHQVLSWHIQRYEGQLSVREVPIRHHDLQPRGHQMRPYRAKQPEKSRVVMCFEFILVSKNQMNYLTYISVYAESFPSFKIQHFIFIFYWLFENCRENQIESNCRILLIFLAAKFPKHQIYKSIGDWRSERGCSCRNLI